MLGEKKFLSHNRMPLTCYGAFATNNKCCRKSPGKHISDKSADNIQGTLPSFIMHPLVSLGLVLACDRLTLSAPGERSADKGGKFLLDP